MVAAAAAVGEKEYISTFSNFGTSSPLPIDSNSEGSLALIEMQQIHLSNILSKLVLSNF